jgi:uncharacterized membrane protein
MSQGASLRLIVSVALFGAAFSGYLTYRELSSDSAACLALGASGTILGYPPCVYGLVMYIAITLVALAGLPRARQRSEPTAERRGPRTKLSNLHSMGN